MKNIKKIMLAVMAAVILTVSLRIGTFAEADASKLKESVVKIYTTFNLTSSNKGISFDTRCTGTGFAVGMPGEPVEYIATASHVVYMKSGMYTVEYIEYPDGTKELQGYYEVEDGTLASLKKDEQNGYTYVVLTDYFEVEATERLAAYSLSDFDTLTMTKFNDGYDVALCKLSMATTKIKPVTLSTEVSEGTDIIAIGFPGIATGLDATGKVDYTAATSKKGSISGTVDTKGNRDSDVSFSAFTFDQVFDRGMSGGPIFDEKTGAAVAIVSFGVIDAYTNESIDVGVSVKYLVELLNGVVDYKTQGSVPVLLIIGVAAGVVLLAIIIILIVLLSKKGTDGKSGDDDNGGKGGSNNTEEIRDIPKTLPVVHKCYLIGVSGLHAGKKYSIETRAVIGRGSYEIAFPENYPGISHPHCEIVRRGNGLTIRDLGSSYGTFFENGIQIGREEAVVLQNGNRFYLGSKENTFEVRY